MKSLPVTMPYCFPASSKELYPGAPKLQLHTIEPHHIYKIGDIEWMPVKVMHDKMPILGFRFGKFAYITDMKTIPDEELPHHSHQLVDDAIRFAIRIGAEKVYFTHMTHDIGLHDAANKRLPKGFQFGYDGQVIEL